MAAANNNLPDFSALSLQAPQLTDLPNDLLPRLLAAANGPNPCLAVERLCMVHREWAWLCRNGQMFDAANKLLGFYGDYDSLERMRAQLQQAGDLSVWFPPSDPKVYFEEVCRLLSRASENGGVPFIYLFPRTDLMTRPYFQLLAEHVVAHHPDWLNSLRATLDVSANSPEHERALFRAVAKVAVQEEGESLRHVPVAMRRLDEYEEIARLAVETLPSAIVRVPWEAPWFMDLLENHVIHRAPITLLNVSHLFLAADAIEDYVRLLAEARDYALRMRDDTSTSVVVLEEELAALQSEEEQGWIANSEIVSDVPTEHQERLREVHEELENAAELYLRRQRDYDALDAEYRLRTNP